jgi:predicted 2-oxoglutarate/Fe(II)-dependent dioxygenase YbiX
MQKTEYSGGIFTLGSFLSKDECVGYIHSSEASGFEEAAVQTAAGPQMHKGIRNNDRIVFDAPALSASLFTRIAPYFPALLGDWQLAGLNERFRFYRYTPGQYFKWHKDGFYARNEQEVSQFSLLLYLNDDYQGGETQFREHVIKPATGMALAFPHLMMHQGAAIEAGVKYVLRTDVMYRRLL